MYVKLVDRANVFRDIKRFSRRNEWSFLCMHWHYRIVHVNGHNACELLVFAINFVGAPIIHRSPRLRFFKIPLLFRMC